MTFPNLETILSLFDLKETTPDVFEGQSPDDDNQRVFGGQVAGQALVAACKTIEDRSINSLHSYFLRPGDPNVPIIYEVERIRDGRSFNARRVVGIQHDKPIFHLSSSFHKHEEGLEHQIDQPSGIPSPEELPTFKERNSHLAEILGDWYSTPQPIDTRFVGDDPFNRTGKKLPPHQYIWIKTNGEMPVDQVLNQAMITYISDITLLDTATLPHGTPFFSGEVMMASIDHAMWFHRPLKADEWFLYVQDTPSAHGSRGFARGSIYQNEQLVVSVAQEGLIRSTTKQAAEPQKEEK